MNSPPEAVLAELQEQLAEIARETARLLVQPRHDGADVQALDGRAAALRERISAIRARMSKPEPVELRRDFGGPAVRVRGVRSTPAGTVPRTVRRTVSWHCACQCVNRKVVATRHFEATRKTYSRPPEPKVTGSNPVGRTERINPRGCCLCSGRVGPCVWAFFAPGSPAQLQHAARQI
jgi:hypothetical protein